MKALTVQQPWTWAILHGGKDVENRPQAWSYRGPLAIHAGLAYASGAMQWPAFVRAQRAAGGTGWMPHGAFIGVVDLVDVHRESPTCCESPWGEHDQKLGGLVHLELANPRPLLKPIRCKVRLRLWTPPSDVLEQLHATVTR